MTHFFIISDCGRIRIFTLWQIALVASRRIFQKRPEAVSSKNSVKNYNKFIYLANRNQDQKHEDQ